MEKVKTHRTVAGEMMVSVLGSQELRFHRKDALSLGGSLGFQLQRSKDGFARSEGKLLTSVRSKAKTRVIWGAKGTILLPPTQDF